jgi:hypothetical protein
LSRRSVPTAPVTLNITINVGTRDYAPKNQKLLEHAIPRRGRGHHSALE